MDRFAFVFCFSLTLYTCIGIASTSTCWETTWHNTSIPMANGSEFEGVSKTARDAMCQNNGPIEVQCADIKHEGFKGNKTEPKLQYKAMCDIELGLVCHPFPNTTAKCPDLAINYGCDCQFTGTAVPTTQTTAGPVVTSKTTKPLVTGSSPPAGPNKNDKQHGGGDNGADRGQFTLAMMVGCLLVIKWFEH